MFKNNPTNIKGKNNHNKGGMMKGKILRKKELSIVKKSLVAVYPNGSKKTMPIAKLEKALAGNWGSKEFRTLLDSHFKVGEGKDAIRPSRELVKKMIMANGTKLKAQPTHLTVKKAKKVKVTKKVKLVKKVATKKRATKKQPVLA